MEKLALSAPKGKFGKKRDPRYSTSAVGISETLACQSPMIYILDNIVHSRS
jgi:hypothetical protein